MSLSVRFLGTSASRPTIERGVASVALVREGETLLVDCGEGTQRQMMRYGISFALGDILFTHFHTDHFLGLLGLLRTLTLQARTEPLRLWGPKGTHAMIKRADGLGVERLSFPLEVAEVTPLTPIARNGYAILPFPVEHRAGVSVGYAFVEDTRRGRFHPEMARELAVPEGPLWGQIAKGESVTLPDGRVIEAAMLVGPTRSGRRVVITGDTRPCDATVEAAAGADLLVHEATFGDEEALRAVETGHSTAREAAGVAARAGVRRLALTHFSARYSRDPSDLEREAKEVFPAVSCARDGMEIEVPFADAVEAEREASPR
ncbi:MAG TPA: ribonuclease Z [Gemmatimonadaceae bacterium]|nr:ribonuclease Z [Gemmatimonadaceae bacterium]